VAEALVGMARACEADEIIVGFRRRGWWRALLSRSVSRAVLRLSDRPVLLVPRSVEAG
jgi:nucleotide-binding universal stress UspA family protein